MNFFFYLYLLVLPLGRVLNTTLLDTDRKNVPLNPIGIVVTLLAVAWLIRRFRSNRTPLARIPNFWFFAVFVGWSVFSLIFNYVRFGLGIKDTLLSGLYLVRWIQYALLYFIVYELAPRREQLKRILGWLFAGGVVFAIFGIVQSIFLPDFALMIYPDARPSIDWDIQGHRLVSTLLDPNIAAGYILIFVMIALSFYLHRMKGWFWICMTLLTALALTLSRGGVLGFIIGLFVLLSGAARKRALKVLVVLVLLGVVLYPALKPELEERERLTLENESALIRIADWLRMFEIVRDNPIAGIGFNTFGFVGLNYGIANEGAVAFGLEGDLFMILVMTGVVGLILYLGIFWRMLGKLKQLRQSSNEVWDKAFSQGMKAAFWAILASGFFTTLLLYPEIMGIIWVLWAIAECLQRDVDTTALPLGLPAASVCPS
jgi:hypothetical protein